MHEHRQDEIGSFDAKTRLPELLRAVRTGKRFTITVRGEPVAELIPVVSEHKQRLMAAAAAMKRFMAEGRTHPQVDVKAMIEEGRA